MARNDPCVDREGFNSPQVIRLVSAMRILVCDSETSEKGDSGPGCNPNYGRGICQMEMNGRRVGKILVYTSITDC